VTAALAATVQTSLDLMALGYLFTGAFPRSATLRRLRHGAARARLTHGVDRLPERYHGHRGKEARLATAGHYNMPSAFPTSIASVPRYRRPLS
jgi:hypothetical protein